MDNVINKIVLGEKNNIKVTMTEIASYNMYIVMNNVLLMYIVFKKKCVLFSTQCNPSHACIGEQLILAIDLCVQLLMMAG